MGHFQSNCPHPKEQKKNNRFKKHHAHTTEDDEPVRRRQEEESEEEYSLIPHSHMTRNKEAIMNLIQKR